MGKDKHKNKEFISITNRDIYDKINEMHADIKEVASAAKFNKLVNKILVAWQLILTSGIIIIAVRG